MGQGIVYNGLTKEKTKKRGDIMKNEQQSPSEMLKAFLDFIETAKSEYTYNLEAMKNEERITQDYLHKLELEGLNCRERSKIATQLVINRQNRRQYKDAVEELEPIVQFFEETQNRITLRKMSELLGAVRKVENYHQRRIYTPKAIARDEKKEKSADYLSEVL